MFSEQMRTRKPKTSKNDVKDFQEISRNVTKNQKLMTLRWRNGRRFARTSYFECETEKRIGIQAFIHRNLYPKHRLLSALNFVFMIVPTITML